MNVFIQMNCTMMKTWKKIKLQHQQLFIQIFQEEWIQLWEKSFKEREISNIKIIKEKTKIQMDKCHGYNITFYVNPQWKWFSSKNN